MRRSQYNAIRAAQEACQELYDRQDTGGAQDLTPEDFGQAADMLNDILYQLEDVWEEQSSEDDYEDLV